MDNDDGFGSDFDFDSTSPTETIECFRPSQLRIHRKLPPVNPLYILTLLGDWLLNSTYATQGAHLIVSLAEDLYGKRQIGKRPVPVEQLSIVHRDVYFNIQARLDRYPGRRQRIADLVNDRTVSKRTWHYFVVLYALQNPISYNLDRSSYPFTIVNSKINSKPHVDDSVCFIKSLYSEYEASKDVGGHRDLHAPYNRGIHVLGDDGVIYPLTSYNFFIWLDDVGGYEAFKILEADVMSSEARFELKKHKEREDAARRGKTHKKRKLLLRNSNGDNGRGVGFVHLVEFFDPFN